MHKRVSVIGSSSCDSGLYDLAQEVGRHIALRKAILICGGLGGVMEAACKGARQAGGLTIGILPGLDPGAANAYVEIPIVTGFNEGRNIVVALSSDAVIAVGGGFGTLSEIAFALKHRHRVIGIRTWELDRSRCQAEGIIIAEDAQEAVERALALS